MFAKYYSKGSALATIWAQFEPNVEAYTGIPTTTRRRRTLFSRGTEIYRPRNGCACRNSRTNVEFGTISTVRNLNRINIRQENRRESFNKYFIPTWNTVRKYLYRTFSPLHRSAAWRIVLDSFFFYLKKKKTLPRYFAMRYLLSNIFL